MLSRETLRGYLSRRERLKEWGLPLLLLVLCQPIFFLSEILFAVTLVTTAFLIGIVLRPKHVWIIWIEAILASALLFLVLVLWTEPTPQPEGQEETVIGSIFEVVVITGVVIALPVFLGRLATERLLGRSTPHSSDNGRDELGAPQH